MTPEDDHALVVARVWRQGPRLRPVSRFDALLGMLLLTGAVLVLGLLALVLVVASLVLLRLLGAPSGAMIALAFAAAGAATVVRTRTSH